MWFTQEFSGNNFKREEGGSVQISFTEHPHVLSQTIWAINISYSPCNLFLKPNCATTAQLNGAPFTSGSMLGTSKFWAVDQI